MSGAYGVLQADWLLVVSERMGGTGVIQVHTHTVKWFGIFYWLLALFLDQVRSEAEHLQSLSSELLYRHGLGSRGVMEPKSRT